MPLKPDHGLLSPFRKSMRSKSAGDSGIRVHAVVQAGDCLVSTMEGLLFWNVFTGHAQACPVLLYGGSNG